MNYILLKELMKQSETECGFDPDKFAELIVRECIDVIGEDNYTMLTGKAYCTELKRHFGVKE
jgi:hypothetical protein